MRHADHSYHQQQEKIKNRGHDNSDETNHEIILEHIILKPADDKSSETFGEGIHTDKPAKIQVLQKAAEQPVTEPLPGAVNNGVKGNKYQHEVRHDPAQGEPTKEGALKKYGKERYNQE